MKSFTTEEVRVILGTACETKDSRNTLWENVLNEFEPESLCEVGVWRGEFADHLLETCPSISSYVGIDPWRPLRDWNKPNNGSTKNLALVENAARTTLERWGNRVTLLKGKTSEVRNSIADQSLDAAYIDGDHTLRGITVDLISMLPKIKPGGFLFGDDLTKTLWQHGPEFSPTQVFPFVAYFAEAHNLPFFSLPHGQWLIIVRASEEFEWVDFDGFKDVPIDDLYLRGPREKVTPPRKRLENYLKR